MDTAVILFLWELIMTRKPKNTLAKLKESIFNNGYASVIYQYYLFDTFNIKSDKEKVILYKGKTGIKNISPKGYRKNCVIFQTIR